MKNISQSSLMIIALALALLSACSGSGGGEGDNNNVPVQPTNAVLTLSTTVTGAIPATTTINSYDVTITLPEGVTVKASPDSINPSVMTTDPGVVTPTGNASGASVSAIYTAANGGNPGTVKVHIASGTGFSAGKFCTINGDVAAGAYPAPADFLAPTLDDATGIDASVSTVILTGELHLDATVVVN